MAKEQDRKAMGVKLGTSWFYTRNELAIKYDASDSFIWKKIQDNKVEEQLVLGYKVYKDDPEIFTKKVGGKAQLNNLPKIGGYSEMYLTTNRIESGNKDIYNKMVQLEAEVIAVKELLQLLLDANTKPLNQVSTPSV